MDPKLCKEFLPGHRRPLPREARRQDGRWPHTCGSGKGNQVILCDCSLQEIFLPYEYKWKEHQNNNNEIYQLVSLKMRSRSSVKKQSRISKGVFDISKVTLTQGMPWKLKHLGTWSFCHQMILLIPAAFLCNSLATKVERGSLLLIWETQSSLSS